MVLGKTLKTLASDIKLTLALLLNRKIKDELTTFAHAKTWTFVLLLAA